MWKTSLSAGSIYEHKNFNGRRKKVHQIDDEARLSWEAIVKTKYLSLTSLAFMQLIPGDDRVVRHVLDSLLSDSSISQSHSKL